MRKVLGREKPPLPRVTLSDDLVRFESGAAPASMALGDLAAIVIETNDSGPWGDDVVWHLLGRAEGCCLSIPQIAEGFAPLLERLQRLPGFDNKEVIAAMGSSTLNAFLCWEAEAQVRPDSALLGFARFRRQQS
ncbi:MAG: hypothetical protein ACKVOI_21320 [Dongiaceae bacterium]